jgi:uncharacterized protein YdeI (BOF family)
MRRVYLAGQLLLTTQRMMEYKAMKQFLKTTFFLPLALTGLMLIAQEPQRQQQPAEGQTQQDPQHQKTITGKIAKSNDDKYVLVDSAGTMYQLDDQSTAEKFAGKKVKVSGTVDAGSNTIHVTEIKAA